MTPAFSKITSDYDSVQQLILRALELIRSDHFDDYFDLFTEDAVWMMPSSNEDVHLAEAKSFYGFTKNFWFDQATSIDELVVSGDIAYVRVCFDGFLRSKKDNSAPPLRSVSRHIWILQRQIDEQWKICRDIWNNPKEKSPSIRATAIS
jgi:ketosteroid isomerase-like protein